MADRCAGEKNGFRCLLWAGHKGDCDYDTPGNPVKKEEISYLHNRESIGLSERLQMAFDVAEMETAHEYHGQTCSMTDRFGISTCPICYFRRRVKAHLGLK